MRLKRKKITSPLTATMIAIQSKFFCVNGSLGERCAPGSQRENANKPTASNHKVTLTPVNLLSRNSENAIRAITTETNESNRARSQRVNARRLRQKRGQMPLIFEISPDHKTNRKSIKRQGKLNFTPGRLSRDCAKRASNNPSTARQGKLAEVVAG